jgi:(p)ppGpp synthase/HD superfamily hydrolase
VGDPITAVIATKKGANIHKTTCRQLARTNPARHLTANWLGDEPERLLIRILVGGENRVGLLRDIASAVARQDINIADIIMQKGDKHEVLHELSVEVKNLEELGLLFDKLENIAGVNTVKRVSASA